MRPELYICQPFILNENRPEKMFEISLNQMFFEMIVLQLILVVKEE